MVRINTRYVSNVSIGFRVRPITPNVRYKPYTVRERHRTRSENNDCNDSNPLESCESVISENLEELAQLKKAKSLESITGNDHLCLDIGNLPDLEIVSNSIQNLKVDE